MDDNAATQNSSRITGSFVNPVGHNDLSEYESARLEQNNVQAQS